MIHVVRSVMGFHDTVSNRAFLCFSLVIFPCGLTLRDYVAPFDEINAFIIQFYHARYTPSVNFFDGKE